MSYSENNRDIGEDGEEEEEEKEEVALESSKVFTTVTKHHLNLN